MKDKFRHKYIHDSKLLDTRRFHTKQNGTRILYSSRCICVQICAVDFRLTYGPYMTLSPYWAWSIQPLVTHQLVFPLLFLLLVGFGFFNSTVRNLSTRQKRYVPTGFPLFSFFGTVQPKATHCLEVFHFPTAKYRSPYPSKYHSICPQAVTSFLCLHTMKGNIQSITIQSRQLSIFWASYQIHNNDQIHSFY